MVPSIEVWRILLNNTAEGLEYALQIVCDALRYTNEGQLRKQAIRIFVP